VREEINMDKLTVVYDGGMIFLGRLDNNILHNPRIVIITNGNPDDPDPTKRKSMVKLGYLPFLPPAVILEKHTLRYPFPENIEVNVYELYLETTKHKPEPKVIQ